MPYPWSTARSVPLRRVTARARPLADFLIIGAQKAGTTSLYAYLTQAPDVRSASVKEVHYFDHNLSRGEAWYRSHFPLGRMHSRNWLTGESSPYYLLHPRVPDRVRTTIPDVRLVAVLRHPTTRAYSHFQHARARGQEPLEDFEQALLAESGRTDDAWERLVRDGGRERAVEYFSYVRRSLYAPQLRRWLDVFPAESLLVLLAEELFADPGATLSRVRTHLGLPADQSSVNFQPRNSRHYERMPALVNERLSETFSADIAQVEKLIGRATGWQA